MLRMAPAWGSSKTAEGYATAWNRPVNFGGGSGASREDRHSLPRFERCAGRPVFLSIIIRKNRFLTFASITRSWYASPNLTPPSLRWVSADT